MKALIDVNIVLDVLLDRAPFVAESQVVWKANHERQIHGYVVATTLTNLFYIARRLAGSPIALRCVQDCLAAFEVLSVYGSNLIDATKLPGGDFEDNVAIRCAKLAGMDMIVTRDPRGFAQSAVPAISPAEFVTRLLSPK